MNADRGVLIPLFVVAALLLAAGAKNILLFALISLFYIFYFLRND